MRKIDTYAQNLGYLILALLKAGAIGLIEVSLLVLLIAWCIS